jgi:hypothetical protein
VTGDIDVAFDSSATVSKTILMFIVRIPGDDRYNGIPRVPASLQAT